MNVERCSYIPLPLFSHHGSLQQRACVHVQEMRSSSPLPLGKVNQLQEALTAYPDVKPRSTEWCLKLIDALFKSKRVKVHTQQISQVHRCMLSQNPFSNTQALPELARPQRASVLRYTSSVSLYTCSTKVHTIRSSFSAMRKWFLSFPSQNMTRCQRLLTSFSVSKAS